MIIIKKYVIYEQGIAEIILKITIVYFDISAVISDVHAEKLMNLHLTYHYSLCIMIFRCKD